MARRGVEKSMPKATAKWIGDRKQTTLWDDLRRMAAVHPVAWAMYASEGRWKRARHLMLLAEKVGDLIDGKIKRLCVSMPPRHGKSEFLSKYLASWWLGTHPTDRVILCSYGERLTRQWSAAARNAFATHGPAVWGLDTWERSAATDWKVFRHGRETGGGLFACGKGGSLTGRGAHLAVIDDLIKDDSEAANANLREQAWTWFQAVMTTRLEPTGRAVVVMTRWHHDDVIGRLKKRKAQGEEGEPWTFLNLPAIAEEGDELGREVGEPLWPERFGAEWYDKIRIDVGSYFWGALYQGRPTALEGSVFKAKWFLYYEIDGEDVQLPDGTRITRSSLERFGTCDLATSEKESADYTTILSWGISVKHRVLLLLDVVRERLGGPKIVPALWSAIKKNGLAAVYVETIGFQLNLIQNARLAGLPVIPIRPDKSKLARSLPAQAAFEGARLLFRARASWLPCLEDELLSFDKGDHDDQVDAVSYGVIVFNQVMYDTYQGQTASRRGLVAGSLLGR